MEISNGIYTDGKTFWAAKYMIEYLVFKGTNKSISLFNLDKIRFEKDENKNKQKVTL